MDKPKKNNEIRQFSLWDDCLIELIDKAKREGIKQINFVDVDLLVMTKSHTIFNYDVIEKK